MSVTGLASDLGQFKAQFQAAIEWRTRRWLPCPYQRPGWRPSNEIELSYVPGREVVAVLDQSPPWLRNRP